MDMTELRIGCSGFTYGDWKNTFYPPGLVQRKWLDHYCQVFDTVELNVTFYRLPPTTTFEKWYHETPPHFAFSLKGSRFITHLKKLIDPEDPLELFFQHAFRLQEKLKVVLWQFPSTFAVNRDRLQRFLALLSRYPVRHSLEFRHPSWINKEIISLSTQGNVSLCQADWPEFIADLPLTADFVYVRRHGSEGRYATCYSMAELKRDALRIKKYLETGIDVFIYFNNDYHAYAPKNARELKDMLCGFSE